MERPNEVMKVEVVEIITGKVVDTVDCKDRGENYAERVLRGMLINMDTDRFFARIVPNKF